jgi:hypothetical protein
MPFTKGANSFYKKGVFLELPINNPAVIQEFQLKKFFVFIFLLLLVLINSCKTVPLKNEEMETKILFKNLQKDSEKIDSISVSGLLRISGVKDIPSGYVQFDSHGNLKENYISFKISFLKKPLIEIVIDNKDVILINHSGKQYIRLDIEKIDFSKFIGINFNPLEVSYLFVGRIPYSPDMELMDFVSSKKESVLNITNNISKYSLYLNSRREFQKIIISNEYFDPIILDSIQYTKNDDGENVPKNLNFSTEDGKIKLYFIIDKSSLNPNPADNQKIDPSSLKNYKEVFDINEIKVSLK